MKTIDLFCASPASTAICSSTNQRSVIQHGQRPINRHHHHHHHDRRKTQATAPCSSQLPFDPHYLKSRNSAAKQSELRRKSSADILDLKSPSGSSRYLLSDFLSSSDDHVSALIRSQAVRSQKRSSKDSTASKVSSTGSKYCNSTALTSSSTRSNDSPVFKPSSSIRSRPCNQVVELRVSIHCKGCEGKVRKHISKMEGVTWFSIDMATKKVTVVGDVTPLGVLTSVSRVKNAEFWPSPTSSSSSSASPMVGLR